MERPVVIHLDDTDSEKVGPRTFRKRILRYGKWNHAAAPGGILDVTREFGRKLTQNFRDGVWDTVAVTPGHPKNEAEGVMGARGAVVGLEDDDEGVWATFEADAETAPKIGKTIKGVSAGLIPNYVDHELGGRGEVGPVLNHLALTNEPYIKGLGDFVPVHLAHAGDPLLLSLAEDSKETKIAMTREELIAKAKELGIDVEALEATAARVPTLEAEITAAKDEGKTEGAAEGEKVLVAALGSALAAQGHLNLAEGQEADTSSVVGAIVTALGQGKAAQEALLLSEATAAVEKAMREGKVLPAQKDALVKVFLSDKATFDALIPEKALVALGEIGSEGINLEEAGGTDSETAKAEIDRYATLAESL